MLSALVMIRKLRADVPQKDNEHLMDDMKKCETKLNASLEDLTSCLCEHPNGGSEDIHNKFKAVLDESIVVKSAAEKAEILAKDAINSYNMKIDEELTEELEKAEAAEAEAKAAKAKPGNSNSNESGSGDDEKKDEKNPDNANGSAA